MKKRVIAIHLLNDRSGSPLVFRQALEVLAEHHAVTLYTATPSGDGFLSGIAGISYRPLTYRWSSNRYLTLVYYLASQLALFFRVLYAARREDTIYINTLLPFGAALAGVIKGANVVYHVHEVSLKPKALKNFLVAVTERCAQKIIFVSRYTANAYSFRKPQTEVIYNCLPSTFTNASCNSMPGASAGMFTVTMLCSLKAYKGVNHFVNIARQLPALNFILVLNATSDAVSAFGKENNVPANCNLYPAQADTIPFYLESDVVCNLSKPDGWIETFGMTLLEGMQCGCPVICPPAGGVLELVDDGEEGFVIDSSDEQKVCAALVLLSTDADSYRRMSRAAKIRARRFSRDHFNRAIEASFGHSSLQKTNAHSHSFPKSGTPGRRPVASNPQQ